MKSFFRCSSLLALLSLGTESKAAFWIFVGDLELAPDSPGQELELFFSNPDAPQGVAGLDFNIQVGDGGPEAPGGALNGPSITNVDLKTGTVFGLQPSTQSTAPSIDQVRVESITFDSGTGTIPVAADASLLMATVTFDTSGFSTIGASWPLMISNTLNGDSQYLDGAVNPIVINSTAGSLTIAAVPEPETFVAWSGLMLAALVVWRRREIKLTRSSG